MTWKALINGKSIIAEGETSGEVLDALERWQDGASRWPRISLIRDGELIGTVSYNLRVWDLYGAEVKL